MLLGAEIAAAAKQVFDYGQAAAFVRRVVGLPWLENASGPDAYDCFGLTDVCQRELFDRRLPLGGHDAVEIAATVKAIAEGRESPWRVVKRPGHGDVVTLRSERTPRHIGTWLDLNRGGLLHAVEGAGVQFDPMIVLETVGWNRLRFYRYEAPAAAAAGERA